MFSKPITPWFPFQRRVSQSSFYVCYGNYARIWRDDFFFPYHGEHRPVETDRFVSIDLVMLAGRLTTCEVDIIDSSVDGNMCTIGYTSAGMRFDEAFDCTRVKFIYMYGNTSNRFGRQMS